MMVDPGRPFSRPYRDLIEELEDQIRYGVEQIENLRLVFSRNVTTYELPPETYAISQVSGLVGASYKVFQPAVDYQLSGNRLIWVNADTEKLPNDGSRLDVEYIYRERPTGLNDF